MFLPPADQQSLHQTDQRVQHGNYHTDHKDTCDHFCEVCKICIIFDIPSKSGCCSDHLSCCQYQKGSGYRYRHTVDDSRQTVRTALNQLEEDGLIVRVKGSGTYVSYENKNEDILP